MIVFLPFRCPEHFGGERCQEHLFNHIITQEVKGDESFQGMLLKFLLFVKKNSTATHKNAFGVRENKNDLIQARFS